MYAVNVKVLQETENKRIVQAFIVADTVPAELPTTGKNVTGLLPKDVFAPFSVIYVVADVSDKMFIADESACLSRSKGAYMFDFIQIILLFYNLAVKKAKAYADKVFSKVPTGGLKWIGAVNYYAELPKNPEEGECYTVKYLGSSGTEVSGTEYAWGKLDGTYQWIPLGPDIDISLYVKKVDADKAYQPKGLYLTAVPQATANTLGGIKAKAKSTESVEAAISTDGKMYVPDMKTSVDNTLTKSGSAADAKKTGDELAKKAGKVKPAKAGNLASLDASGNLTDSGMNPISISVEQTTLKIKY